MIILKESDVQQLLGNLSTEDCLHFLKSLHSTLESYSSSKSSAPSENTIYQPQREVIATNEGNTTLFMPCSITTSTAIKIVTLSSQGVKGCINVFAPDGELLGLINAKEVTAFRTSLAVMIPFLRFPQEKANIVVFGAGKQAEWHIRLALLLCKDVKRITIVNRTNPAKMEQLFETLRQKYPDVSFDVLVTSVPEYDSRLQELLSVSDCIFGCTPATTPHFPNSYLSVSKPRFISLIGSYKPSMQEVDGETLLSGGKIFVDSKEDCLIEAGELINAGVREDQLVEIGDIENYERVARTQTNHVFKCVGLAIMDILAARELLSLAKSKGLGLDIGDL